MAWTSPQTAVTGDILTASFWNSNVRDNFLQLAGTTGLIAPTVLYSTAGWGVLYYNSSGGVALALGSSGQLLQSQGASTAPAWVDDPNKTYASGHTWAIPSIGSSTESIVPFFIPGLTAGQTATLKKARYVTTNGTVVAQLQRNSSTITGYSSMSASTAAAQSVQDSTLAGDDLLSLVLTTVSTDSPGLTMTLTIEYTQ